MIETLLDRPVEWLSGQGTDADYAIGCRVRLQRNLADFPFPSRCVEGEKRSIEERVVNVLENLNLTATGVYWSLGDLDGREIRFLTECYLISPEFVEGEGPRGVYIADDLSFSIAVNDDNHLLISALGSGLELQETWARVNLIDDMLSGALDFAFSERLGYLTTSVGNLGTGLTTGVILHLPALKMIKNITPTLDLAREKRHLLLEMYGPRGEAHGDLYRLANLSTLGRSEEEINYHVKHVTTAIIDMEREARDRLMAEAPLQLEDRIGRALGLARGARLLAFNEALSVLSSLRLGLSLGKQDHLSLRDLNEVFVASRNAHLQMKYGHDCDELTLSSERAELLRARFS